eukprot:scaffold28257_cov83-Skeletonema_marinoi.AAC.2
MLLDWAGQDISSVLGHTLGINTLIDRNFVDNKSTVPSSTYEDQQTEYPHFSTATPSRRNGNVLTVSFAHNSMDVQINVQRNHHAGHQSGNNLLLNQRYHLTGDLVSPIAACIPSPCTPTQKTDIQTTESSSARSRHCRKSRGIPYTSLVKFTRSRDNTDKLV